MNLNQRTAELCDRVEADAELLHARVHRSAGGGTTIDLGIEVPGGLTAGVRLAEICLAGLGHVELVPSNPAVWDGPAVAVSTDHPLPACIYSQYAGWQLTHGDFFAMGSGPMRAAAGAEELFTRLGYREQNPRVVGVLETRKFPPPEIFRMIAERAGVEPNDVTLLVAPTASLAGTVQIVARAIETTLHKLLELGFDLKRIQSGWGVAPLPPVAADDLVAIGRTNDAILYGGEVTLWLRGDDQELAQLVTRVPSSGSSDYGEPFAAIFERYQRRFYDIDPHLFSPAAVTLVNLDTGNTHHCGRVSPETLRRSFEG